MNSWNQPHQIETLQSLLKVKEKEFFLISFKVPNVEAALAELREKWVKLIDQKARSIMGQKFAFIDHPKDLCGLLAEVIE